MDISTGCICHLVKEFSKKTAKERKQIFEKVSASEIPHVDFTFARVEKQLGTVLYSPSK